MTQFKVTFKTSKNLSVCIPADCLVDAARQSDRVVRYRVQQSASHHPNRTAAESFARMLAAQRHVQAWREKQSE